MSFFTWARWLRSLYRSRVKTYRKNRTGSLRLNLEALEDRTMMSVLPAAMVSNQNSLGAGINPQIAIDPINPQKMVVVASTGGALTGYFSTDGGADWNAMINVANPSPPPATLNPLPTLDNPALNPGPPYPNPSVLFAQVSTPSIAFDRTESVYVVELEHDAANTNGALVFQKFDFSGAVPAQTIANAVLYAWSGQDPIFNPVVAVDNNTPTYTDPQTGAVQTDTLAQLVTNPITHVGLVPKGVYVAWNTSATAPAVPPVGFQPNAVMAIVSPDGGTDWTNPDFVSNNGFTGTAGSTPQIVFTQGSVSAVTFSYNGQAAAPLYLTSGTTAAAVQANLNAIPALNADGGVTVAGVTGGPFTVTFLGLADPFGLSSTLNNVNYFTGFNQDTITSPAVPGGQLIIAWDRIANGITINRSLPDGGVAANFAAAATTVVYAGPTAITQPVVAGPPQVPVVGAGITNFVINVTNAQLDSNIALLDDLTVSLSILHPHIGRLNITLTSPTGRTITLLQNSLNTSNAVIAPVRGVLDNANLGTINDYALQKDPNGASAANDPTPGVATVFDDKAARNITDTTATAPYVGHYRPENGSLTNIFGGAAPLTRAQLIGNWTLTITDVFNDGTVPVPAMRLEGFALNFTGRTTGYGAFTGAVRAFGIDKAVPTGGATQRPLTGSANDIYPLASAAAPGIGIGPGVSIAVDNTLGSFSPFQGRLYIAYTGLSIYGNGAGVADNTDVYLVASTDDGTTWTTLTNPLNFTNQNRVDDDTPFDGTEGTRPQFEPAIAVDPTTGTLVVTYYDARNDAARARVVRTVTASIDGGQTFSKSTYLNTPKTATDAITGKTITIEPIPGNQGQAGAVGFGDRQGLAVYGGNVYPMFSSNLNAAGANITTATTTIAAGPRVVSSDMGPVTQNGSTGTYDTSFTLDGTRQMDGFTVTFDRPVDPATFTPNQVTLKYQSPTATSGTYVDLSSKVTSIQALNVDATPTLSIGDAIIKKGSSGFANMLFPVILSQPQTTPVMVEFSTINGTAVAGTDFAVNTDAVTFTAGTGTVHFSYNGVAATIGLDFDAFVTSPGDVEAVLNTIPALAGNLRVDGFAGSYTITFLGNLQPALLTAGVGDPVTIAPASYNGSVVIPAGQTSAVIAVPIAGNGLTQADLNFTVRISAPSVFANVNRAIATGTIVDPTGGRTSISVGDAIIAKGFYGTVNAVFPVVLSAAALGTETVDYTTVDGVGGTGATIAKNDYQLRSGTISFVAGQTIAYITVPVIGGSVPEGDVTFTIQLSNPVNLTAGKMAGTGTIVDSSGATGATTFLVRVAPQSAVGTYSYAIGPFIRDRIRSTAPTATNPFTGNPTIIDPSQGTVVTARPLANQLNVTAPAFSFPVTSTLTTPSGAIPLGQVVRDLTVNVTFNHPIPQNVELDLIGPDGFTTVVLTQAANPTLFTNPATTGDFLNTTFDDTATQKITTASPPYDGTFRPAQPLSAFFGQDPNFNGSDSTWTLVMTNNDFFSDGKLINWSITIQTGTPVDVPPFGVGSSPGNFMDQNQNGITADLIHAPSDIYANPEPTGGVPFQLPYNPNTLPLIIPGPHAVDMTYTATPAVVSFTAFNGSVVLAYNGVQAAVPALAYDSTITTAAAFRNYLNTIPGLTTPGSVNVTGSLGGPFTVTLASGLNVSLLTVVSGSSQIALPGADTISFTASSGAVTLAYNGAQAPIPTLAYDAATTSAAEFQTYLSTIPGLTTPGNVSVAGNQGGPFTVTFGPGVNASLLTVVAGPARLAIASTQLNLPIPNGIAQTGPDTINFTVIAGTVTLSYNGAAGLPFAFTSGTTAAQFQAYLSTVPGLTGFGAVSVTGPPGGVFTVSFAPGLAPSLLTAGGADPIMITPGTTTAPAVLNSSIIVTGIPAGRVLSDLNVNVSIYHENTSDLQLTLIAPDGTKVPLAINAGFGANFNNTTFDDQAPFQGSFQPQSPLSALYGKSLNGLWTLQIANTVGSVFDNLGILAGWSMTAQTTEVLNAAAGFVDVTFDRDIQPASFTAANIQSMMGPAGAIGSYKSATIVPIPDQVGAVPGTLTSTLTINDSFVISHLGVQLNITHAHDADLTVVLIAPDATQITLFANVGGNGQNFSNTIFDDSATTAITSGVAPYASTFRPAPGALSAFIGKNLQGTWKLKITDSAAGNVGTLNSWSLIANPFTITANPPGTPAALANRTFRIGFPTQTISGNYNIVFGPDSLGNYIRDVNGNAVDTNLNAGVNVLRGADPNNGTILPISTASGTINLSLPPAQTVNSMINVPGNFLVQGVSLQLNIQHQNDPDLSATLIAPDGTSVLLFSGVGAGAAHANFTGTTFDDSAASPIQLATTSPVIGIGAGPFTPQLPLSTFKNHGSLGLWTLSITSSSSALVGKLVSWTLTLKQSVPGSGLGEPVADQFSTNFRIFVQDPTNVVSQQGWTAVGPASINNGTTTIGSAGAGRVGNVAVDPSDPSGNTVYVGAVSGGIWKTTNFLTTDPMGPSYVPLTDSGPGNSLNTGNIAVFGRNKDPNQSIIFAATGNTQLSQQSGVGLLRSLDGGKTWRLLDSTNNVDANGNVLAINDPARDHLFLNRTGAKVLVDPTPLANGNLIVYAAFSTRAGNVGGVWRSSDTGNTWIQLQAGDATDIALAAGSAGATGNLQILYAGFRGLGVFYTPSAPSAASLSILGGGTGVPLRRDEFAPGLPMLTVGNLGTSPNGANGMILLGTPALTGSPLKDTLYEGWLYALVITAAGRFQGLYLTKDFGLNWTQIHIPSNLQAAFGLQVPTNNEGAADYDIFGSAVVATGNSDAALVIDPNNPNIIYIGGNHASGGSNQPYILIRVDATTVADPYALVAYDNSNNDGGLVQFATTGPTSVKAAAAGPPAVGPGTPYGLLNPNDLSLPPVSPYYSLERDPNNPFLAPATSRYQNVGQFNNSGQDATWLPFDDFNMLQGSTNIHAIIAIRDPLTGGTRLIIGDDAGVFTGVDNGDGTLNTAGIGTAVSVTGSRNGNLQITEFNDGAVQPSTLAADLAGALFYGATWNNGTPISTSNVLSTGNIDWTGLVGENSAGTATDQTGTGTSYFYKMPCCINSFPTQPVNYAPSDFFQVGMPGNPIPVSRTTGLLQAGDNPATNTGQWRGQSRILANGVVEGKFAVNPIDPTAIVISSDAGRVFLTSGPSLGTGVQWFPIANPTDLDSSYADALAFGAPSAPGNVPLDNFIYAGTINGNVFVTTTGGGVGTPWKALGSPDGSSIMSIVTDPTRGTHDLYVVTANGVFYMADSSIAAPVWTNITGNLFNVALTKSLYNDPTQQANSMLNAAGNHLVLTAIAADWRFAIPTNLALPVGPGNPAHPALYVGGEGGVYRSLDQGTTWTYYPDIAGDGATQNGGFLPSVRINKLSLAVGNLNPADGTPSQTTGYNMLVATTFGRGDYAIRLDSSVLLSNGKALSTYAVTPVEGPHVESISAGAPSSTGAQDITGINVTFNSTVDPATFTVADVISVTGPNGAAIPVSQVVDITVAPVGQANPHNVYEILFTTPQTGYGFYKVTMGPAISDYSGNLMDQNQNFKNGENPADIFTGRFLAQPWTNNAPVLGVAAGTVPAVNEDATAATITGTTVNGLVTGLSAPGITDPDNLPNLPPNPAPNWPGYAPLTAPVGIAVIGVDNTNGDWQYSLDGGATWIDFGTLGSVVNFPTTARMLEANSGGVASNDRIRFVPNANYSGPATFTFRAWDLTSGLTPITGADGGTADTSTNGGSTAFSAATATATITVNFVNDMPSFTKGVNQTALEDTGTHTVNGWATNLSPDTGLPADANEAGQLLDFIVSNNNNSLFAVQPAIDAAGNLTYTVAVQANGVATVTVQIHDNGGTALGGIDTSGTQTFTITVTAVNDPPFRTAGNVNNLTVLENSGFTTLGLAGLAYSPGPIDEAGQTLTYTATAVPLATFGKIFLSNGVTVVTAGTNYTLAQLQGMQFKPTAAATGGPATFSWRVRDNGGVANGGADTLNESLTISITLINDPPFRTAGTVNPLTVLEDSGFTTLGLAGLTYAPGGADEVGQTLSYAGTVVPSAALGTIYLADGVTVVGPGPYSLPQLQGMQFKPAPDANGGPAIFSWTVQDNGGTANGGIDTLAESMNISVTAVNDAPIRTAGTVSGLAVLENSSFTTLGLAALLYAPGSANESGQTLTYTVTAAPAPAFGAIYLLDGVTVVTANTSYSLGQLQGMQFKPTVEATGGPATFDWKVQDNGGVANGGVDTLNESLTINITAVNSQPVRTAGNVNNLTVGENSGFASLGLGALAYVPGDAADAGQMLTITVFAVPVATLGNVYLADGVTVVVPGPYGLAQLQAMQFMPAPGALGGPVNFSWTVQDNGGTLNGGVDTLNESLAITVAPVNTAPIRTGGGVNNLTVLEDASLTSLGLNTLAYSPGGPGEGGQTLTYSVTAVPAALGTVFLADGVTTVSIGVYSLAQLQGMQFKPSADANGGPVAFSFKVQDNGGTAFGGVDTLNESLMVSVTAVNDPPVRSGGGVNNLTVLEDSGLTSLGLSALAYSPGPANEAGQGLTFSVTAVPAALGTVFLADGVTMVTPSFYSLAQLQGMQFKPAANVNGGPVNFAFQVQDNGGTANGGVDVLNESLAVNVTAVNDPPVRTAGSVNNLTVLEDSNLTSLGLSALAYSPGPADESGQTLSYAVTVVPAALGTVFLADGVTAVSPGVYTLADLQGMQFKPSADANGGPASFTFTVQDTGGTANGGANLLTESLSINVTAVNDPPVRTGGSVSNLTVLEDSSLTSLGLNALAYSPGPANEAGQTLTYTITATPTALGTVFLADGVTVVNSGSSYTLAQVQGMQFKPSANVNGGPATFAFKVQDNAGTLNGGADTLNESLTVSVTAVNDPPARTAGSVNNLTVLEDANLTTLGLNALAYSPGPADEVGQSLSYAVTVVPASLGTVFLADGTTAVSPGTYSLAQLQGMQFKPNADANGGPANFTFTVQDNGGTANGGVDILTESLGVSVTAVNDPPVRTAGSVSNLTVLEDAALTSLGLNTLAYSPGPANEAGQTLTYAVTATPIALGSIFLADGVTVVNAGSSYSLAQLQGMQFKPSLNLNGGPSNFAFKVQDNGGVANSGVDTLTETLAINVTAVNDPPVRIAGSVNNLTVLEDANLTTLGLNALAYGPGAANEAGQTFTYTVTAVPLALGTVFLADGTTVVNASTNYTLSQLQGMQFKPAANVNGGPASFSFTVQDNGGTANGGADTLNESLTVSVTAVNDPPVRTAGSVSNLTVLEDAALTSLGLNALAYSPGNASEAGQTLTYTVTAVPLALGTVFLADGVTVVSPGVYPLVQLQGMLFKPSADANGGPATFSFKVQDNGGTAFGGSDTLNESLTVSVTAVNDPPVRTAGSVANLTVLEDAPLTSLGLNGLTYGPGPANEAGQALSYAVTAVPAALGTVFLADGVTAVAPGGYSLAQLQGMQFKPAANVNGGPLSFSFTVQDSGGTANGGVDTLTETLAVSVTAVNDVPVRTAGSVSNLTVLEDAALTSLGLSALAYSPGNASEAGQTLSYTVTAVPLALGTVFLADGTTVVNASTNYNLAQLQGMQFKPAADVNGGPATFSFKVQDNGGTSNGGVDTLNEALSISVTAVNDAPVRSGGSVNNLTVLEDSSLTSLGFGTLTYSPGSNANEAGQTLTYTVTAVPVALGTVFLADGTTVVNANTNYTLAQLQGLQFKPSADINGGPASLSWRVKDNGGVANGGFDTLNEAIVVNVTFVNDAPSFTKGANQTVPANAAAQSITGWATKVSADQKFPSASNEALQVVNFIVSNNNNTLFSVQPSIDATGKLTYTPAAGKVGAALVTVQLHDNGGVANGGADTSASQTFTITVTSNTTTTLTIPVSSTYGQAVTFTAQVTPAFGSVSAIASETVTFKEGATTLGTGTLDATGKATFSTSTLPAPSHTITAVYSGDPVFLTSTSTPKTITVAKAGTTTAVTTSQSPTIFGQSVTFTAKVTPASGSVGVIAGELVTFKEGATTLGTGVLNASGFATFSTSTLSVATHTITAVYAGDTSFFNTSSGNASQVVKVGTSTTLTSSPNPSALGAAAVFTAKITPTGAAASALTGQLVTFKDGNTTLGTAALNSSGIATFSTTKLTLGNHNITAVYAGAATIVGSTSNVVAHAVLKGSVTTLTSSSNPSAINQPVTFTATVSGSGATPTGTVTFYIDGIAQTPVTLNGGKAMFTISTLSIATHSIVAVYSGDATFVTSKGSLSQTVLRSLGRLV